MPFSSNINRVQNKSNKQNPDKTSSTKHITISEYSKNNSINNSDRSTQNSYMNRLTWIQHIKTKRVNLNLQLRLLKNLIINNKYTHVNTKLIIHKSLVKPIWTYGLQL